ncbi:GDSL-type esterase/lipase family protein [Rhabdothermincola salaria]|uniref:GDSL-type esterase/lipase family protein n=1 Tax=Rhabdothermincola salaria TaxID=2903142 RepID=UPI001E62A9E1|nr:GDSL-type esterase/lipase family protein [Rhabdothermincola salaria]MCD9625253.1 GDSL-type esterase/lipase family protein [Rhabdothermincola salaria]
MSGSRAQRLALATLTVLVVASTMFGVSPSPVTADEHPQDLRWLAMGDSYSSGEGTVNVAPDGPDKCQRADGVGGEQPPSRAWPIVASDSLTDASVTDLVLRACTGATTANLFNPEVHFGLLNLTTTTREPQWTPADGRFDLVTLTAGGNDIGFADTLAKCLAGGFTVIGATSVLRRVAPVADFLAPGIDSCLLQPEETQAEIVQLGDDLRRYFEHLADQVVHPGGLVVVAGYPNLVSEPDAWNPQKVFAGRCETISPGDARTLRGLAGTLNATIGQAAADVDGRNGVTFTFIDQHAELYEHDGEHHSLCGRDDPWLNGLTAGITSGDRPRKERSFHPHDVGHTRLGELAATHIDDHDWSSLDRRSPAERAAAGRPERTQVLFSDYDRATGGSTVYELDGTTVARIPDVGDVTAGAWSDDRRWLAMMGHDQITFRDARTTDQQAQPCPACDGVAFAADGIAWTITTDGELLGFDPALPNDPRRVATDLATLRQQDVFDTVAVRGVAADGGIVVVANLEPPSAYGGPQSILKYRTDGSLAARHDSQANIALRHPRMSADRGQMFFASGGRSGCAYHFEEIYRLDLATWQVSTIGIPEEPDSVRVANIIPAGSELWAVVSLNRSSDACDDSLADHELWHHANGTWSLVDPGPIADTWPMAANQKWVSIPEGYERATFSEVDGQGTRIADDARFIAATPVDDPAQVAEALGP